MAEFFVVCFHLLFWGLRCTKPGKIQKLVTCAHTTNQKKDCDYVIYAKSMSIKRHEEKMSRVNGLPTLILTCSFAL